MSSLPNNTFATFFFFYRSKLSARDCSLHKIGWKDWVQSVAWMKIDRHGQAKILTTEEIKLLFNKGFTLNPKRDKTLFAVCLYTACRISECVSLHIQDVFDSKKRVRNELIIRKGCTKGKLATRTIPIVEDLKIRLEQYQPSNTRGYLFPGRHGKGHLKPDSADCFVLEQNICKNLLKYSNKSQIFALDGQKIQTRRIREINQSDSRNTKIVG